MGLGRMTYSEATTSADNLNKSSASLEKHLKDLRYEIDSMDDVLRSEGAEQLLKTYEELDNDLRVCPQKITGFEVYLRGAIKKYQEDDQRLEEESK